jgi:hypothetical protein
MAQHSEFVMRNLIQALLLMAALASSASAQFIPPALPPGGQITSVPSTAVQSPYPSVPYSGVRPVYTSAPGGFPGYYGGTYIENPISGYYNGVANVIGASGQYNKDYQQARLMNQDVERSKLATRRQLIEQMQWEQSLQPKAEDVRRYKMEQDLRRAINDPPLTEIISGDALNILLSNIQKVQAGGGYGPLVPLDQDVLNHINLTTTPGANIALFKDGGKLRWPFVLRDTPWDKDREKVQDLVYKALKETQGDELSPATLRELKATIGNIDSSLDQKAPEMSIPDSIQARRYVDELKDAVRALENPNASKTLNNTMKPQGRSVGDLLSYMTRTGLRFAPALQGEEGQYRALHQGMVSYSLGAMQSVRR